jgi:hypothetical protein
MKKAMTHGFKRQIQKIGIKVARILDPEKMHNGERKDFDGEAFSICRRLIGKEESTLLVSPISGKRYIKSDDRQLYVIIEPAMVTIVNHAYSYNIPLDGPGYLRIVKSFDNEVERRRELMEAEIRSNVKHSLSQIYKNIINENI